MKTGGTGHFHPFSGSEWGSKSISLSAFSTSNSRGKSFCLRCGEFFPGRYGPGLGRQGIHLDQRLLRRLREGAPDRDGNGQMEQRIWIQMGEFTANLS